MSLSSEGTPDLVAFEQLVAEYGDRVYGIALRVTGSPSDAEDVMQESLLKTYQHVNRISDPGAFRTWLYTTVRNACLMKRRRHVGEPATFVSLEQHDDGPVGRSLAGLADNSRPADQRLIDNWMDGRLRDALKTLPASYRMIVVMREMEGLSTKEVADITGLSEANVKTRLHRARLMLRRRLEAA